MARLSGTAVRTWLSGPSAVEGEDGDGRRIAAEGAIEVDRVGVSVVGGHERNPDPRFGPELSQSLDELPADARALARGKDRDVVDEESPAG